MFGEFATFRSLDDSTKIENLWNVLFKSQKSWNWTFGV